MAVVPAAGPYVVSTFLSPSTTLAQRRRLPLHCRFPLHRLRGIMLKHGCRLTNQWSSEVHLRSQWRQGRRLPAL